MNSSHEQSVITATIHPSTLAFLSLLQIIQKDFFRCAGPVFILIGTISGIISLFVFTQKDLRKSPCSIYFIAYNISTLVLIYISFLPIVLEIGYELTPTTYHLILCRIRLFTTFLMNCLCPFYLLLASVDRMLVTSPNARTRQRSTHRFAYKSILIGTIAWIVGFSHVLIFAELIRIETGKIICYVQLGLYSAIISYCSLVKEVLIPSFMILFGLTSIRNIRHIRINIITTSTTSSYPNHTGHSTNSARTKDRQLILMLLIDITIYIFFSFIMAVTLMYEQITRDKHKSLEQFQIESLIKSIAMFAAHIPFCINSYANLLVSKTFRKEVKELFTCRRMIYTSQPSSTYNR